ncbi:MAG: archease [Deltaproteobacteria bacterium]
MNPRSYRFLPHTADIRLEVRGSDLAGLFEAGVSSLFSLITDRRRIRAKETRTIEVAGNDLEERLFILLREALLLFSADRFLIRSARGRMKASGVTMEVRGEAYDASRHAVFREIKAVTAHGISVERKAGRFVARFVVDV